MQVGTVISRVACWRCRCDELDSGGQTRGGAAELEQLRLGGEGESCSRVGGVAGAGEEHMVSVRCRSSGWIRMSRPRLAK